jgi:hypothetical protein
MKLLGRSAASDDETVRRVTGHPGEGLDPDAPAAPHQGPAPLPSRLSRLSAVVERATSSGNRRNVRKIMETIGMAAIAMGFVAILLGWYGSSHSPYLYQEIPYLISGGLLGVALVIGGGVLVRCAWSLRQVEEERRNALAVVRSIDRLERILRASLENGTAEKEESA